MKQSRVCIYTLMVVLLLVAAQSAIMAYDDAYPISHSVTPAFQQVYQGVAATLQLHSRDWDYFHGVNEYDLLAFPDWPPNGWTPIGSLERSLDGWYTQTCTKAFTTAGNYQISITADDTPGRDNDDPANASVEVEVLPDTTPPVPGTATSPAQDAGSPITVAYSGASDDESLLDRVELWYKKGLGGTWLDSGLRSSSESGQFGFSPPSGYGTYYFDLVAQDKAGNRSAAASGEGDCSTMFTSGIDPCAFSSVLIPVSP